MGRTAHSRARGSQRFERSLSSFLVINPHSGKRNPDADVHLILGGDSLVDLPLWYQPRRILELAGLLVVGRPGWSAPSERELKASLSLADDFPLRIEVIECPPIAIASRDLRKSIAEGKSVRYQLPRAVEAYVAEKKLYETGPRPS